MLKDAAHEMALAYYEDGDEIPQEELIVKPIDIPLNKDELLAQLEREGLRAHVV